MDLTKRPGHGTPKRYNFVQLRRSDIPEFAYEMKVNIHLEFVLQFGST